MIVDLFSDSVSIKGADCRLTRMVPSRSGTEKSNLTHLVARAVRLCGGELGFYSANLAARGHQPRSEWTGKVGWPTAPLRSLTQIRSLA